MVDRAAEVPLINTGLPISKGVVAAVKDLVVISAAVAVEVSAGHHRAVMDLQGSAAMTPTNSVEEVTVATARKDRRIRTDHRPVAMVLGKVVEEEEQELSRVVMDSVEAGHQTLTDHRLVAVDSVVGALVEAVLEEAVLAVVDLAEEVPADSADKVEGRRTAMDPLRLVAVTELDDLEVETDLVEAMLADPPTHTDLQRPEAVASEVVVMEAVVMDSAVELADQVQVLLVVPVANKVVDPRIPMAHRRVEMDSAATAETEDDHQVAMVRHRVETGPAVPVVMDSEEEIMVEGHQAVMDLRQVATEVALAAEAMADPEVVVVQMATVEELHPAATVLLGVETALVEDLTEDRPAVTDRLQLVVMDSVAVETEVVKVVLAAGHPAPTVRHPQLEMDLVVVDRRLTVIRKVKAAAMVVAMAVVMAVLDKAEMEVEDHRAVTVLPVVVAEIMGILVEVQAVSVDKEAATMALAAKDKYRIVMDLRLREQLTVTVDIRPVVQAEMDLMKEAM